MFLVEALVVLDGQASYPILLFHELSHYKDEVMINRELENY